MAQRNEFFSKRSGLGGELENVESAFITVNMDNKCPSCGQQLGYSPRKEGIVSFFRSGSAGARCSLKRIGQGNFIYKMNSEPDVKKQDAKAVLEAEILKGLNSGEATPLTVEDWRSIREQVVGLHAELRIRVSC